MKQTTSTTLRGFYSQFGLEIAVWIFLSLIIGLLVTALVKKGNWRLIKKENISTNKYIPPEQSFLYSTLGCLWIFDGFLQAQPTMASSFTKEILSPLFIPSQPSLLNQILRWEIYGWQVHPATTDIATALIQIGLGIAILVGRNTIFGKIGLWSSIVWSLVVWVGGEALGGILAPGASEITGWPGAVLFYGISAGLLLLPSSFWNSHKIAKIIRLCLGITFILGAILQGIVETSFWKPGGLSSIFLSMSAGEPSFLSVPIITMANWTAHHPVLWNGAFTAIMAIIGIGLLSARAAKKWLWITALWLLITWWIGQAFGGIFSGMGTDPNLSFPLLLLLTTKGLAEKAIPTKTRFKKQKNQALLANNHWPIVGGLIGLIAIIVGTVPTIVLMPSWVSQPTALDVAPPPPITGVAIPLATMTAELNVDILASKGRLQVDLQAPHSNINAYSSTVFGLSGQLRTPNNKINHLRWLGCGQGCFVTDVNWQRGVNHLSLHARASGWKGGNASFNIAWPPIPNATILPKVVKAMQNVKSLKLTQIMTSDTNFGSFTSGAILSGSQILHDEPNGLRNIGGVVVLNRSSTSTKIAFGSMAQGNFVELTIGPNYRIIREKLVQPQQLTIGNFTYS